MKLITIRNRFDDSVIFEHECENNTIKLTVEKAVIIGADLRNADLRNADLRCATNKELAYFPIYCKWSHSIKGDKIQIGCEEKTIEEWVNFFEQSTETYATERDTQDFKQIKAVFYSYKAYLDILNNDTI